METGELIVVGRIVSASNTTLVCDATAPKLQSDAETAPAPVRCVYKRFEAEVPLWDFPEGTLAGREVASYEISDALGWGVVPTDGPA